LTTEVGGDTLRFLLLKLTTTRRLALTVLLFLAWTPAAHAWTWPVQGPVLQPFAYDEAHPYAAGQHRGIDIGADAAGEQVVAPAAGTVSFVGSVPTSGESVTIETPDGYSVTLTHLGSVAASKGASVEEGDAVGTIGPSGTPEVEGAYVHLGIRVTSDANGYLDPLGFLPPLSTSGPTQSAPPASQPSASGGAATTTPTSTPAVTPEPATSTTAASATARGANVRTAGSNAGTGQARGRAQSRAASTAAPAVHTRRSSQPELRPGTREQLRAATPHRRIDAPTSSSRRPVVEVAAHAARLRLDAGHELRRRGAPTERSELDRPSVLLPLSCNGAAALVALAAAFAASRGARRRRTGAPSAQLLHLPRPAAGVGHERRAA
jgi:Peptidase family M23